MQVASSTYIINRVETVSISIRISILDKPFLVSVRCPAKNNQAFRFNAKIVIFHVGLNMAYAFIVVYNTLMVAPGRNGAVVRARLGQADLLLQRMA